MRKTLLPYLIKDPFPIFRKGCEGGCYGHFPSLTNSRGETERPVEILSRPIKHAEFIRSENVSLGLGTEGKLSLRKPGFIVDLPPESTACESD